MNHPQSVQYNYSSHQGELSQEEAKALEDQQQQQIEMQRVEM